MRDINVNKSVLSNGLRIITSFRDSDIFSMGVGIKVGSLYEDEKINGVSHMIEHMLFKGTHKRDTDRINSDIERLAGDLDIYTTYHQTVLTIDIMREKAEASLELVSDMLKNSVFPEDEFKLEKKVIIEEIKMEDDDSEDLSYLGLYKQAFTDEWYKYHIAGTVKSLKGIKVEFLRDFYHAYYVPNNVVICVVSSFTHDEVVKMVEGYFGDWKYKEVRGIEEKNFSISPKKVEKYKEGISQTHVLYGFDIQDLNKREEAALTLLNEKIGAGANSVLFKELRDKRGFAYSVYSNIDFLTNLKMFYIYAGISEENLEETLKIIDLVIEDFKKSLIRMDDESIDLIRDIFKTHTAIAMESSSHMVDYLLDGELDYGNPLEFMEVLRLMDSIGSEDIRGIIEKVLKNPIVHILKPKN